MLARTRTRQLLEDNARLGRILADTRKKLAAAENAAAQAEARTQRFAGDRVRAASEDAAEMALLTKERDEAIARCLKQERIIAELQANNEAHYRELSERAGVFAADAHAEAE